MGSAERIIPADPSELVMTLSAGMRLGPYEVLRSIGAGGMGEVYRARDTRLGREVAIKVLPAERLADEHRRARFVQEARAASTLNHPNIVTIHEIEAADGIDFIVMELVEGETLARQLRRGPLPIGDALRMAIPLADALATAHARGIVHRDLKPANVMLTADGVVKVLDFGLAKLVHDDGREDGAGSDMETASAPDGGGALSRPGAVLGTAGYLSPEQASGGVIDARSDIFTFGVLLYEMVTGRRAFGGDSSAEAVAAVLRDQPKPPSALAPDLPKELERIILRCLRKEPSRRFQSMLDAKVELQEVKEESDSRAEMPAGIVSAIRRRRRMALVATAVLVLATAGSLTLWFVRRPELAPPTVVPLTSERRAGGGSFSPDGTQIAFASLGEKGDNWDIWLKIVGQAEARRLTADATVETSPAWSPDGTQIAFLRSDSQGGPARIYLVSPLGGPARRLSEFPTAQHLSWSRDGRWVAAAKARSGSDPPGGIYLIPVAGGEPRELTFPNPGTWDGSPSFSPDGRVLAYASCGGVEGGANSVCDLRALPLDSGLRPYEAARALTRRRVPMSGLAWSRDGRSIIYCAGGAGGNYLWRVRGDGGDPPERVELAGRGAAGPCTAASRDRLAFTRSIWEPDIYRLELGGSAIPLLESSYTDVFPQYSPDGRRIAFESGRAGGTEEIWLADADGSNPTRLTRGPGHYQGSPRWSPDGRSIAFDSYGESGHPDIWTISSEGSGLRQVTHDAADDTGPSWSRDGRFIYFTSNRTGRNEVWRVAAAGGADEQISLQGGASPLESADGRTLYYVRTMGTGPLLARPTSAGEERTVLECAVSQNYAVTPLRIFYMACAIPGAAGSRRQALRFRDTASGQNRLVATLDADWIGGLSVSPDGRSLIYGRTVFTSDLMLIENFR